MLGTSYKPQSASHDGGSEDPPCNTKCWGCSGWKTKNTKTKRWQMPMSQLPSGERAAKEPGKKPQHDNIFTSTIKSS